MDLKSSTMSKRWSLWLLGLSLSLSSMLWPTSAHAQARGLDDSTFISGLEQRGMSELILHYLEVNPPRDPVVRQLIEIAQNRLRFRDDNLSREDRMDSFLLAVESIETLIREHQEHPQSPIWMTDLASMLMVDDLRTNQQLASEFVCFGVPTDDQAQAFEDRSIRALAAAELANRQLFKLQGELGRDDERAAALKGDGTWQRLFQDYGELRTPFFTAMASLHVAMLPDDSDYYQSLGRDDRFIMQAKSIARERQRLIGEALLALEPLTDINRQGDATLKGSLTLMAQLYMLQGQVDLSHEAAEKARSFDAGGTINHVSATLAMTQAMVAKSPSALAEAESIIDSLLEDQAVLTSPFYRLLLADAKHQLRQSIASNQDEQARSYEPYLALLEDRRLGGDLRDTLRAYIYRRWAESYEDASDFDSLPPIVRMGMGDQLLNEARLALGSGDMQEAMQLFAQANRVNETLLDESLPEGVRATGMNNLALGQYFMNPQDPKNVARAAALMTDLAEQLPAQPLAEQAIANAVSLTRPMAIAVQPNSEGRDVYLRAVQVLLETYPTSAAADGERLVYALSILQPAGEHEQAIRVLEPVPFDHPSYLDARSAMLRSHVAMFRATINPSKRASLRKLAQTEASRLRREAQQSEDLQAGLRAAAESRFTLAAVAADQGDYESAARQLDGFQLDFASDPALLERGYQEAIQALVQADQIERAVELGEAMTREFPDSAAFVINGVITNLDTQIQQLRLESMLQSNTTRGQELMDIAKSRGDLAARLTGLLLEWAEGQGFTADELLAYQTLHGKTLRMADQLDESLEVLEPLLEQFSFDGNVLLQYGETQYARYLRLEDPGLLTKALSAFGPLSDQAIYPTRPLPDMFWLSNLRIIQIMDLRQDDSLDIRLRIRRLEQIDRDFGGEHYSNQYRGLLAKHS